MKEWAQHVEQGAGEWAEHKKTWPTIASWVKENLLFQSVKGRSEKGGGSVVGGQ